MRHCAELPLAVKRGGAFAENRLKWYGFFSAIFVKLDILDKIISLKSGLTSNHSAEKALLIIE